MKRVIVVGSGLAGLSAGYRLRQQGWHVTVLETLGRVGGRVLSESEDGFLFDVGPVLITDGYREYLKLVADVGLSDEVVDCAPEMAVVNDGELCLLDSRRPLRSFLTTKLLPARAKLRLIANGARMLKPLYGMNPYDLSNRIQYDNQSVATYLNRVFGREINERLVEGLTRSMTTGPPDETSVLEFFAAAVLAAGKMQSLRGGLQRLPSALAAALDVKLNSPVTGVRRTDQGVEVQWQGHAGPSTAHADACVIATRFRDATELYPPLKDSGAELLAATRYTGALSMQLAYTRPTEKQPFLVMVPTAAGREVLTLCLEHAKAPDRAPAGTSLISVFFSIAADEWSSWSDDRLTATARELIERVFPELCGHFRAAHLTRWSYASHRGDVGYYTALQRFRDAYPSDDPVQVAGDYLAISSQESAVVAGTSAARRILSSVPSTPPMRVRR